MATMSSCQAAPSGKLEGAFFHILYNQSLMPRFEIANFEKASNNYITVVKLETVDSNGLDFKS